MDDTLSKNSRRHHLNRNSLSQGNLTRLKSPRNHNTPPSHIHQSSVKSIRKRTKRKKEVVNVDTHSGCSTDDSDGSLDKMRARPSAKKRCMQSSYIQGAKDSWETSSSEEDDDDSESHFVLGHDRFANVTVKKSDCYYRSNLQTTVRELTHLKLTKRHIAAIKHTPFWLLVKSIMEEDEDLLRELTRKNEADIRLLVKKFDVIHSGFRIGERVLRLQKRDLALIFGVRDGTVEINVTKDFNTTPWMLRCFPELLRAKGTKKMASPKKFYIYKQLKTFCRKDDKIHSQDVARLMHCYLPASLFMPNGNTSFSWSLCEFLEEFSGICKFDWSTLVINRLVKKMSRTTNMKFSGCAMLLPYWLCEHTSVIHPRAQGDRLFPRYLRWDLNQLHQKLSKIDLDVEYHKLDITTALKPISWEKSIVRALIKEIQEVRFPVDRDTQAQTCNLSEKRTVLVESLSGEPGMRLGNRTPVNCISEATSSRGDLTRTSRKDLISEYKVPDIDVSVLENDETLVPVEGSVCNADAVMLRQ